MWLKMKSTSEVRPLWPLVGVCLGFLRGVTGEVGGDKGLGLGPDCLSWSPLCTPH